MLEPACIKPNVPMLESALRYKKNHGTYKAECDVAIEKKPSQLSGGAFDRGPALFSPWASLFASRQPKVKTG